MRQARPASVTLLALLALSGCARPQPSGGERHALSGKVVSVDAAERTITIAHGDIPGFMQAMTMPFVVLERDLPLLKTAAPGAEVAATLVSRDSRYWLEDLVIVRKGTPDPNAPAGVLVSEARLGEPLPETALVDQGGRPFALTGLRGKAFALTFVYTRCPLPEFCPLMMRNFARAEAALVADPGLRSRTHLVTVSFDPRHDTPEVLLRFGRPFQKTTPPFTHWTLATGSEEEIRRLGTALELEYVEETQSFTHNLRTAVVGPDGRLRRLLRGGAWTPEQLVAELRAAAS